MSSGFFGIGLGEIAFLMILAVLMFGPEKLPEFARKAARVVKWVKDIANNTTNTLRTELGPGYEDLTLQDLNPKVFVQKHLLNDLQDELSSVRNELDDVKNVISGAKTESSTLLTDVKQTVTNAGKSLDKAQETLDQVTTEVEIAAAATTPFDPEST